MSDIEQTVSSTRESPKLPPDGTRVRAMTYDSAEYNTEAEEVTGVLTTSPSPFGTPQCWINGIQVDPHTIEPIDDTDSTDKD